jgi:hypothetical protein
MVDELMDALDRVSVQKARALAEQATSLSSHGFTEIRLAEPACDY